MHQSKTERILIIEDDRFTCDLLREELQELGYEVAFLENGKEALSVSHQFKPDCILLDIMMPEVDGYTTCQTLRKDSRTAQIPIIFITAKDTPRDLSHGLSLGANDYIVKPFNMEVLSARIETQLRAKRLLDQVHKQNKELERLNTSINEFLGMASHDLRTPASVIELIASTLLDETAGPLTEIQKSLLTKLYQQTRYMNQLLNDLLSLAHIASGKIVLHLQQENINLLLKENLSALTFLAKNKSIAITLTVDATLPDVPLDKARFTQIVDNIISNAIKFTPPGGKISVKTSKSIATHEKKWACISISDTGVGMDPQDLQKLFHEYTTGSAKPTRGEKSTGLGLSIAKKITELHQGVLEVTSKVGAGTEFLIKFPLP